ncbi:MAG: hypothetical protein FVQ85_14840, partial [Planctomycetes bacterium]|nr:hypothetical protein [Planctomycetota bacterium]
MFASAIFNSYSVYVDRYATKYLPRGLNNVCNKKNISPVILRGHFENKLNVISMLVRKRSDIMHVPKLFIFCLLFTVINSCLPNTGLAATYYVDPSTGNMSNDGSSNSPWKTVQEVFDNGLMRTVVQPGDTVYLRDGYHGQIYYSNQHNSDYITVAAQPGHTPGLRRIRLTNVGYWIFRGLTISPELAPTYSPDNNVDIRNANSNHVIIEGNNIYSRQDSSGWNASQWVSQTPYFTIYFFGTDMVIRNNTLKNVYHGIVIESDGALVEYNSIENFAGDGMIGGYSNVVIQYNVIKNRYDVDGNHDDAIQFHTGSVTYPLYNVVFRGNLFIAQAVGETNPLIDPQAMGFNAHETGMVYGWRIENNVVITSQANGIHIENPRDTVIINNIAFNPYSSASTWIYTNPGGDNNVVRNNMAHYFSLTGTNMTADHNIDLDDYNPEDIFVDPFAVGGSYDLRHKEGSPLINAGSSELAPDKDILEVSRPQGAGVDIGAYEYVPVNPDTTPPSVPQNLTTTTVGESQIDLAWEASSDPESSISFYRIYRDNSQIDTSVSTSYPDTGLNSGTTYSYEVSAVNGQGLESTRSNAVQAATLQDTTPPSIVSVSSTETSLEITFSELLDSTSAEQTSNYSINNGISVIAASLDTDTVTLTTSAHPEGFYTLTVVNVQDTSGNPMPSTTTDYEYDYGLLGHWQFDDGSGNSAVDSTGNNNTGTLINGPTWTTGKINGALNFDGVDDAVQIGTGNFNVSGGTIVLWVYAESFSDNAQYLFGHATQPWANRIQLYTDDAAGNLDLGLGNSHTRDSNIQDLNADTWYHIALTWNGTNYVVYTDGQPRANGTYSGLSTLETFADIGNDGFVGDRAEAFDGIIDDVRIYNRALAVSEILDLFNEGTIPDTDAPVISNVQASNVTASQATITWDTDEASNSQVEYGPDTNYGNSTILDANVVTSHSTVLTGLSLSTTYHFRVKSTDTSGNDSTSGDNTFTTSGVTTYSITASAGSGGTISPSGSTQVNSGGAQTYTITSNTGYSISDVLVDGSSVGAVSSYSFTNVTANHTIAASFAINTYSITASAGSGGTISPSGSTQVNSGGAQTYTITPNTGYSISDVLVDGSSVGAVSSYSFT